MLRISHIMPAPCIHYFKSPQYTQYGPPVPLNHVRPDRHIPVIQNTTPLSAYLGEYCDHCNYCNYCISSARSRQFYHRPHVIRCDPCKSHINSTESPYWPSSSSASSQKKQHHGASRGDLQRSPFALFPPSPSLQFSYRQHILWLSSSSALSRPPSRPHRGT